MSGFGWQDATVALLAAAALTWLIARRVRARKGPACEDCPGCRIAARKAAAASTAAPANGAGGALIPLSELTRRGR